MSNTYSQVYIHIVFGVSHHQKLIDKSHKEELHRYITGIIKKRDQKLLAINIMPDHAHIFIKLKPESTLSYIVRDIKSISSKFINTNKWIAGKFNWQQGYGAFSYSHSQVDEVKNYISRQEKHHKKKNFQEEYLEILEKFEVEYEEEYVFD